MLNYNISDLQYFDPIDVAINAEKDYERYLLSNFHLRDNLLNKKIKKALKELKPYNDDKLFLEFVYEYKIGKFLDQIEGVNPIILDAFNGLGTQYPLYKHQEEALVKSIENKNILISTGTGSGKTESFLLPIINHLANEITNNTIEQKGVRALILYPLNALVNDQLKRLKDILNNNDQLKKITFGMYTGETPQNYEDIEKYNKTFYNCCDDLTKQKIDDYKCCENLIITRDEIRQNPPHILITNYSMLEYLLLRPKDLVIFSSQMAKHWKFLVLDEAHTYDGALAIEISMLISKLKYTLNKVDNSLQCIATSATIVNSSTRQGKDEFIEFGKVLFGEYFDDTSLIFSQKESNNIINSLYDKTTNFTGRR